ncbi:MAG: ATP-binding cassette domain-containing protein [Eubacteriales bacterium]|nr:ATP-binding cassette domain-containing protein [Eubacteriales bacterium]
MEKEILTVKKLHKVFRQGKQEFQAVDHISFSIRQGECFGLIGESGSGKSTAANMVSGLLKPTSGEIQFHGSNLQMVFQDPKASFSPQMRILDGLCEGLRYRTGLPRKEREARAYEVLEQVGLKREYARKYCYELSGGECQRAAIGRAIMIRPELLICDEVTSALDVSVQEQIILLLKKLGKDHRMSYLFISHDLALVSGICDRIAVMHHGKIVEMGDTQEVISHPKEEYTKRLLDSVLTI